MEFIHDTLCPYFKPMKVEKEECYYCERLKKARIDGYKNGWQDAHEAWEAHR